MSRSALTHVLLLTVPNLGGSVTVFCRSTRAVWTPRQSILTLIYQNVQNISLYTC